MNEPQVPISYFSSRRGDGVKPYLWAGALAVVAGAVSIALAVLRHKAR